ncbi:hypothetical protein RJ639_010365 [Escallonia herrerae]|uniref:Protein-lysine N-methyltransferase RJ639_010365 n=1 Tax=Escallonia herrerae TaxID=1293975 RepID=A0AA88VQU6_9ASTE|nr:hypothetical protein RJ639_010365 [Escallonia herrerae]
MGNYLSCTLSAPAGKHLGAAKVIFPTGEVRQFCEPTKAAEIMLECPNFFLVNSSSLQMGRRFSALNADEDLEMASVYTLFPMKRVNSVVTAADLGALFLSAKRVSVGNGRISPECGEVMPVLSERAATASGVEAGVLKLDTSGIEEFSTPEFQHRLSMCRSKKPLLETIAEEPASPLSFSIIALPLSFDYQPTNLPVLGFSLVQAMAGIRLPPEDNDASQARATAAADLISDDDRSVAADSWSIKSDYGSTLDDDQRHADASDALAAAPYRAASDYSSDKEEPDAEPVTSMLGFQSYWDAAYADELVNFREHGHAGEVWFGADVMEMVASWTKRLCIDISRGQLQNHLDDTISQPVVQGEEDLSSWSVLDVGTGNGLLLQELSKQGFSDLTGTDYSEGAIDLARSIADRDGFTNIKFLVDDALETKLDKKFKLVMDKGTLDAIGLHPDGPIKRIMYWDSISRLVSPKGLLVITSCNSTKDELVQEVDNFNQRRVGASQENETRGGQEASRDSPPFRYLDHIRSYPTFMFGGTVGSRVATIAFLRN